MVTDESIGNAKWSFEFDGKVLLSLEAVRINFCKSIMQPRGLTLRPLREGHGFTTSCWILQAPVQLLLLCILWEVKFNLCPFVYKYISPVCLLHSLLLSGLFSLNIPSLFTQNLQDCGKH